MTSGAVCSGRKFDFFGRGPPPRSSRLESRSHRGIASLPEGSGGLSTAGRRIAARRPTSARLSNSVRTRVARGRDDLAAQGRVRQHAPHGVGQRVRLLRRHEQPRHPRHHQLRDRRHVGRHHRHPHGHALEQHVGHPVPVPVLGDLAPQDEEIRAGGSARAPPRAAGSPASGSGPRAPAAAPARAPGRGPARRRSACRSAAPRSPPAAAPPAARSGSPSWPSAAPP